MEKLKLFLSFFRGDVAEVYLASGTAVTLTALWFLNLITVMLTILILIGTLIFTYLKVIIAWRAWKRGESNLPE